MDGYQREEDSPGNDIYSLKLDDIDKVNSFFDFNDDAQDKFIDEMKDLIKNWLQRLGLLVRNAEMIKRKQEE